MNKGDCTHAPAGLLDSAAGARGNIAHSIPLGLQGDLEKKMSLMKLKDIFQHEDAIAKEFFDEKNLKKIFFLDNKKIC